MELLRDYSKGQIGVIMTLVMATLLGAIALGTDVAVLYYNWVQLQKAADAGVLAGANYLTGDTTTTNEAQVISTAKTFAQANGVQAGEIVSTWTWNNDSRVSMRVSRSVPYFFLKLLALTGATVPDSGTVAAQATAGLNKTDTPGGFIPIGLPCNPGTDTNPGCSDVYKPWNFTTGTGTLYTLKAGPKSGDWSKYGSLGAGNWEPLALGANGGDQYKSNIINGYTGTDLTLGTMVSTETGNLVGPTIQGFSTRLSNAGETTFVNSTPPAQISSSDPQVVLVPLTNFAGINGKGEVPIVGWLEMYVVGVTNPGGDNNATISAYIIQALPNNGVASASECKPGDALPINSCTPVLLQ